MVPFMKGWNEQMYANVPAVSKVAVALLPGAILPVSNVPDAVAVWAWASLFVHVTVSPTEMSSSGGPNLKPAMSMAVPDAAGAPVVSPVGAGVVTTAVSAEPAIVVGVPSAAEVVATVAVAAVLEVLALSLLHAAVNVSRAAAAMAGRAVRMLIAVSFGAGPDPDVEIAEYSAIDH